MANKKTIKEPKEEEIKVTMKAEDKEEPKEEEAEKSVEESEEEEKSADMEEPKHEEGNEKCSCGKCSMKRKGALGGENPKELSDEFNQAGNTITPNNSTPSAPAHSPVGPKTVEVGRNSNVTAANGVAPNEVSYTGKSVNTDLNKSPLFVELSKSITSMENAVLTKLESVEKSFNDRIANLNKKLTDTETFYKSAPLYKAINEEAIELAKQKVESAKTISQKAKYSF